MVSGNFPAHRRSGKRKFFRRRSGSPGPRRASTAAWEVVHTGTARGQQRSPLRSQLQQASTVVIVVCRDLDQATASQRFQGGGQSCPIRRQMMPRPQLWVLQGGSKTSAARIAHASDGTGAVRCRKAAPALARRAAHEGRGKNRGPGWLFRKMCLELLPYVLMINSRYAIMLDRVDINLF
jgi:hypothetical protein